MEDGPAITSVPLLIGISGKRDATTRRSLEACMNAKLVRDPDDSWSRDDDPRLAFVYQEAVRGLVHQQNVVESLNNRAGNLIFATAFVTSLFGTRALTDGVGFWDCVALAVLFLIGILTAFMLWPYYNYTFRFDPEELLAQFIDGDTTAVDVGDAPRAGDAHQDRHVGELANHPADSSRAAGVARPAVIGDRRVAPLDRTDLTAGLDRGSV